MRSLIDVYEIFLRQKSINSAVRSAYSLQSSVCLEVRSWERSQLARN